VNTDRLRAAYTPLEDPAPPAVTAARLRSLYDAEPVRTRGRGRRRWRRISFFALGGVVLSGTAIAATGAWSPQLGSPGRGTRPLPAAAAVPAEQLASLGILRRPQTEADRGAQVQAALKVLGGDTISGIHTDALRVITSTPREVAILIPVERYGSRATQRDGLCLMSSSYSRARTVKFGDRTTKIPAGFGGWGSTCGTLKNVRTTGIETGTTDDPSGGLIINGKPKNVIQHRVTLVPDGVARVTVRLRGGRTVTVPVHDNIYRFDIRGTSANLGTTWYDTGGQRIDHRKKRPSTSGTTAPSP